MRAILLGSAPEMICGKRSPKTSKASLRKLQEDLRSIPIRPEDFRVGVDGGVEKWLKFGWRPHFAVGDWDSLKEGHLPLKELLAGVPYITLPTSKDRSDLFYAARAALELGADELVCLGVTGGRIDHQLAAIFDLAEIASGQYGKVKSVRVLGDEDLGEIQGNELVSGSKTSLTGMEMVFLTPQMGSWKAKLPIGARVSVFALGTVAEGVTLKGFQYPLTDQNLSPSSLGLSNQVKKRSCEIQVRQGTLLVTLPRL